MTRRLLGGDRGPCGPCTSRKDVLRVGCRWSLAGALYASHQVSQGSALSGGWSRFAVKSTFQPICLGCQSRGRGGQGKAPECFSRAGREAEEPWGQGCALGCSSSGQTCFHGGSCLVTKSDFQRENTSSKCKARDFHTQRR